MDNESYEDAPIVPSVTQPNGLRYLFGTWSGRILCINTLVFGLICWLSHSILFPDESTLIFLGAKDPVKLVQGQVWRLVTPMFLHIGLIHFAFNSYFLYVVGYQIETILGGFWFLLVYLLSGIGGNIASAALSVNMSAGASSALFGLLGAGFLVERRVGDRIRQLTGRRPRNRAYTMTLVINLGLGLLIPFIDNSAHIGGLVAGVLLTASMMNLRSNNLQTKRPIRGLMCILALATLLVTGFYFATSSRFIYSRLVSAGNEASDDAQKIFRYTQALQIYPDDSVVRLKRARAFVAEGAMNYAFNDLRAVIIEGGHTKELEQFVAQLEEIGQIEAAWQVKQMISIDPQ